MLYAYKENGKTMDSFTNELKEKYNLNKIAYTARLDPMARGIVSFLLNENCKNMDKLINTNKTYRVKIIVGIQTDTDDSLGLIFADMNRQKINYDLLNKKKEDISDIINKISGKFNFEYHGYNQKYHHYSTKQINHRRRNNNEDNFQKVIIYNCKILNINEREYKKWNTKNKEIIDKIPTKNNFRQKEIINQWKLLEHTISNFIEIEIELNVSNGFFVRQFIRDKSIELDIPMCCYDIYRIKIN